MKKCVWLTAFILSIALTGCGYDEFQGRFIDAEGNTSYEFQPDGTLEITEGEEITTAEYEYNSRRQIIKLSADQALPTTILNVKDDGNLASDEITLTRGVDYAMLTDTTWIGHQGQYTFALTFSMTEQGLETVSELVSYNDEDKTYTSQIDDSITRLDGNMLLLDLTPYIVSEVSRESFKISIGENSMVLEKHPKGSAIDYREGYQVEEAL
ncbi:DUF4923 family protein [Methylophaga pinxianii]|uniref:DUF4923 family protein n=1 Tax=Methylophaga pinxianii TaxID=2881052 RepID=UPI001CF333DD|nr:DUF4923 family protein [Methylophaga pinxianii]MCB2425690.1 DUF4923 family protein [Methylophaga pinxianii]UPH44714.1 DUF4923 family protein [Methylophaga pinxianii]